MRIMSLDYGESRIGIAMTDSLGWTINEHETYNRTNSLENDVEYIVKKIKSYNIKTLVVGLPINLDGRKGEIVNKVEKFANLIKGKFNIDIVFQDERLSSLAAEEVLKQRKVPQIERKKHIDKVAAAIILQDYILSRK